MYSCEQDHENPVPIEVDAVCNHLAFTGRLAPLRFDSEVVVTSPFAFRYPSEAPSLVAAIGLT